MMETLGLRVLVAIADAGSVTGAARELGYTPSNVTQHLRRLEATLGAPMVERVGRGVVLTERAHSLAERGRRVLLELDDLAAGTAAGPSGRIDVASFPTGLRGLLIPAIADLALTAPDLEVRPREGEPVEALAHLRAGRVHAAVVKEWGASPVRDDEVVQQLPLGTDPIDAILPAGHPLAGAGSLGLRDLGGESWALTPDDDPAYRQWFANHQRALGVSPPTVYEAAEYASMVSFVEHGLAVAAVPRLGRGPLPPTVVAVPLHDADAHRTISVAVRRTSLGAPNLAALVAALRGRAGAALMLR